MGRSLWRRAGTFSRQRRADYAPAVHDFFGTARTEEHARAPVFGTDSQDPRHWIVGELRCFAANRSANQIEYLFHIECTAFAIGRYVLFGCQRDSRASRPLMK